MSLKPKDIIKSKLNSPTEHDLVVDLKGTDLVVQYTIKTWRALYDISDINGRILLKGELETSGSTAISLSKLKPNNYILWVVDGADLLKYNFALK